jgi:hypothetical protein
MHCKNCGQELPDFAEFCNLCGANPKAPPKKVSMTDGGREMLTLGTWQDSVVRVLTTAIWYGAFGAIAGLLWGGALRVGIGWGALCGGVGMFIVGAVLGFWYLVVLRHPREGGAFLGGCLAPVFFMAVIGGIVWIVRAIV